MATLQKFKLLATQCAVVGSPTRSPTTSPVIHIRRRKTLRMLLGRGGGGVLSRRFHHQPSAHEDSPDRNVGDKRPPQTGVRLKLKDLFFSSSPPPPPAILGDEATKVREEEAAQRLLPDASGSGLAVARRIGSGGGGSMRPLSATLRQRLLMRRMWRPVLVAIPEQSP